MSKRASAPSVDETGEINPPAPVWPGQGSGRRSPLGRDVESEVRIANAEIEQDDRDELLGRCLNDTYVVEDVLGEGGMGRVYRARHTRIPQKQFALKVLRPDLAREADQLRRFQREAETAACINHPNVIGVYDIARTPDGWSYLVCELLEGFDLDEKLEAVGKLDVLTAVRIALQLCSALDAAHAHNVVHRDLKPQNIFLLADESGHVPAHPQIKVLDFGLSRFLDTGDAQLTRTGVVMGTPAYIAPEQVNGKRPDHRVDVYGIGAILYAMLTGRVPFEEDTLNATLLAVLTREPTRPRDLNPDTPENLEMVIQRCMAKDPADRYSSVAELRSALAAFDDEPVHPSTRFASVATGSRLHLSADAFAVSTARARLVFYGLLFAIVGLGFSLSAVSGVELFTGRLNFTRTELMLLLLGITGTLMTPLVIAVRRFRRTIWTNSARVLDLLDSIRGPVVAALTSFGLSVLVIRFADDVVSRFALETMLGPKPGLSWSGWTWLLPLIALIGGGISFVRYRLGQRDLSVMRRHLIGAPLIALATGLCAGILLMGFEWRSRVPGETAPVPTPVVEGEAPARPIPATPGVTPHAVAAASPQGPDMDARATDAELTKALGQGVDGLLPLSEKYPGDPRVLEPLMLAFASRATTLADAMSVAERLFGVAPERAGERKIGDIIQRGAATPGSASKQALTIMAEHMGSRGPDLLYELWLSTPKLKEETGKLLEDPEVQKKFTPALQIAYELRLAETCEDRLPLLERAGLQGDERSISVLSPLTVGTKRGCGKWKNKPCAAPCAKQKSEYLDAIRGITQRLSDTQTR